MDLGLKGKVVVVTGGSRGIGRDIALAFAREGANLVLCARGKEALDKAVDECNSLGVRAIGIVADVGKKDGVDQVINCVIEHFSRIDILINNAGEAARTHDAIPEDEIWQEHFNQYVLSVIRMTRKAIEVMLKNGGGRIIDICSSAALEPGPGSPARSGMKAVLLNISKVWSKRYASQGIIFNTVSPGLIKTERLFAPGGTGEVIAERMGLKDIGEALTAFAKKNMPLGRFVNTEEVGVAVVMLASPVLSGVVGVNLIVDGGAHASI